MDNEKVSPILLKGSSKKTFLLFHGYTGSPRDFENLPEILKKNSMPQLK